MAKKIKIDKKTKKYITFGIIIAAIIGGFFLISKQSEQPPTIIGQGQMLDGKPVCARAGLIKEFVQCFYICPEGIDCENPDNYKYLTAIPINELQAISLPTELQSVFFSSQGGSFSIKTPAVAGGQVMVQYAITLQNTGNVQMTGVEIDKTTVAITSCKQSGTGKCASFLTGGASTTTESTIKTKFTTELTPATPQTLAIGNSINFQTGVFSLDSAADNGGVGYTSGYKIALTGKAQTATGAGGSLETTTSAASTYFHIYKSTTGLAISISNPTFG